RRGRLGVSDAGVGHGPARGGTDGVVPGAPCQLQGAEALHRSRAAADAGRRQGGQGDPQARGRRRESRMTTVLTGVSDGVWTSTLTRPHRLNAMTEELVEDFDRALAAANADPAVAVLLLGGAGKAFCAGDDLKEFEAQTRDAEATRRYLGRVQDTVRKMFYGEKPIVGAARGWAAGGGFEWLINCDFVVMGEGTRCFFPEVSLGFI